MKNYEVDDPTALSQGAPCFKRFPHPDDEPGCANPRRRQRRLPRTDRAAITAASAAERDRELKLLGITAMQPPATAYDIGKPGNANYDESKANPYPKLPTS